MKETCDGRRNNNYLVLTVPPLKVITSECKIADGDNIDTPSTACTERSDGEELNCCLHSTISIADIIPTMMYYIFIQQKTISSKGLMSTMTMMLVIPMTLIIGMQIQSMSMY